MPSGDGDGTEVLNIDTLTPEQKREIALIGSRSKVDAGRALYAKTHPKRGER